uniref:Reverse transcriptase domain-containing protein n=1 Tax=Oryzias melastigma TaxID=30732 RepID=A0A3B3B502_ORYME
MSFNKYKSKTFYLKLNSTERKILEIEQHLYHNDNPEKYKELIQLKAQYNELTTNKIAANLMWVKQSYYDQGEKAGKLLAWRTKKIQSDRAINIIQLDDGKELNDPIEINSAFRKYYEDLYKSDNPEIQHQFLDNLKMPTLTEEEKVGLERNITMEELLEALKEMSSGKAPGPDGLPIELYKKFAVKLLPHLLATLQESYETGVLPPSLRSAVITLLLKPGKPPNERTSYRPISLMSCDTKILCKAMAKRIEKLIPHLIHLDQNGFVQGRQAFHNIRRLLNIIFAKNNAEGHALLSLDAEKAFDRVEWEYLFEVLKRFGFGERYMKWIRLLYTNPVAEVLTNNYVSKPFKLCRSTRQGCPLSPLLFLFAIEPLAIAIRQSPEITGITIGREEHRLALFADDIVLFLTDLNTSIESLNKLLHTFGRFSGYKINNSKSALLLLNEAERKGSTIPTQFTHTPEGFTYLGIKITPNWEDIVAKNYEPLMKEVEELLDRWRPMPVSMIGRINIIKMSILPKFLYLFQSIPLSLPASFFTTLRKFFSNFIWNSRRPRLRLSLLYLPYDRGGLKVPNMKFYYWATQLRMAMFYFSTKEVPAWVGMENDKIGLPLYQYIYSSQIKTLKKQTQNPFLKNTILIWHEAHTFLDQTISLSKFSPIWGNNNFVPGRNDMGFKHWMDRRLTKIGDLYDAGSMMSFQHLAEKYNLPRKYFFKYLQIRSFIFSQVKTEMELSLSTIEHYTVNNLYSKGQLSGFYNILLAGSKESSNSFLSAWKRDLKSEICIEDWNKSCLLAQTQTIATRNRLLQYKWLFRTYITPVKLHHFNPDIPDTCIKCNTEKGTLLHCLWDCEKLQIFWTELLHLISKLTSCVIPLDPKLCVLHMYPKDLKINSKKYKLIDFSLLQAKRVIALNWRNVQRPTTNQWLKEMSNSLALEKLTYIVRDKVADFHEIWTPFTTFLNDQSLKLSDQTIAD